MILLRVGFGACFLGLTRPYKCSSGCGEECLRSRVSGDDIDDVDIEVLVLEGHNFFRICRTPKVEMARVRC